MNRASRLIFVSSWLIAFVAGTTITAALIYWIWNAVVPQLFGLPAVSFVQAIGLSLLCALLFKAFRAK